jgi:uncharacterized Zn finger protein
VLSERDLEAATDPRRFDHGLEYVRYVHGLRIQGHTARATIQARRVYQVELTWAKDGVVGWCSCPDSAAGYFCKHAVAVGRAAIDAQRGPAPTEALDEFVAGLSHDALVDLVLQLVDRDQEARNVVMARAAAAGQADALDPKDLVSMINEAMSAGGFVDYRRSFDYARDVEAALDQLEELLELGAADAVAPALLRATTRMRKVLQSVDDSAGVVSGAGQRAAELYARACREGHPDPAAVARWLVKFRRDSPGWPHLTLQDFVAAFDAKALAAYRRGVAAWSAAVPVDAQWGRFEVDRARLELLDHDGDLDAAIHLLSEDPERTAYGDIVERLSTADRDTDAVAWLDRAVAAGRVSGRPGAARNDYWIAPRRAAELYLRADRPADAVAVMRSGFSSSPGLASWRDLLEVGRAVDAESDQRTWGSAEAERLAGQPYGNGAYIIEIALAEDRLDDAWTAAERFGAGHSWEALVKASTKRRPADAARLYIPKIEELLRFPDTRKYGPAAGMLAEMRKLLVAAGEREEFADYVAGVRERFGRRPSLMAELARRGL